MEHSLNYKHIIRFYSGKSNIVRSLDDEREEKDNDEDDIIKSSDDGDVWT